MAKMLINEKLVEEIKLLIFEIEHCIMQKIQCTELKTMDLHDRLIRIKNVLTYLDFKRSINEKIDLAITGYNQSLVTSYLKLKEEATRNLTEQEIMLL